MFGVRDCSNNCNKSNNHTQRILSPHVQSPTKVTSTPVLTVFSSCCCHPGVLLFIPKTYSDQSYLKTPTLSFNMGWRAADYKMVSCVTVHVIICKSLSHLVVTAGVPVSSRVSTKIQQLLNTLKRPKRPPLSEFFTDDSEEIVEGTCGLHLIFYVPLQTQYSTKHTACMHPYILPNLYLVPMFIYECKK